MQAVEQKRWKEAQIAESQYWDGINIPELLRICAEKPAFLEMIGNQALQLMLDRKDVLEIGVGPLGISLASFYSQKSQIQRLVKIEPLAKTSLTASSVMKEEWATLFLEWLNAMTNEGDYVQQSGETLVYADEFDTVIIYNVLDHVENPSLIVQNAYRSLRAGGQILIGVDCRSWLGRIKFEYILRNVAKGSILVEAHPHTFLPQHVIAMLKDSGFQDIQTVGIPAWSGRMIGKTFRPAFIGKK